MVEEIIKNARMTSSGRRILSSVQKASIVEDWETSDLSCPEFCRRHDLISSQLYKWRSDAKTGFRRINIRYQDSKKKVRNGSTEKQEVESLS